jgi:predicted component of type VI protein secretion system
MSGQTQAGCVEVPSARLDVRDASGAILSLDLGRNEHVVGADPAADLAVTDPAVSRRHFAVRLTEHGVRVRDLESKNGLYVDRTRVLDGYCSIGSVLTFGACRAEVVITVERRTIPLSRAVRFGEVLGASMPMRALLTRLQRLAADDQTVLIVGESGTGKELDLPLKAARDVVVASFERRYIQAKIAAAAGNMTHAASSMGISRQYLYRLLEQHALQPPGAEGVPTSHRHASSRGWA